MVEIWHILRIISFTNARNLTKEIKLSLLPKKKLEFESLIEKLCKLRLLKDDNFYNYLVHDEDHTMSTDNIMKNIIFNLALDESLKNIAAETNIIIINDSAAEA